jgi:DNA adenine methylase
MSPPSPALHKEPPEQIENLYRGHPLLKWPGGKTWLASFLAPVFERELSDQGTYYEAFLGGGAVFFFLHPKKAVLSDVNRQLIEFYQSIQSDGEAVLRRVWQYSNSRECYYRVRRMKPRTDTGRAAQFLFLNRTCWGGVFRLNRDGKFNVPFGDSGRIICRRESVREASRALKGTTLQHSDFEEVIARACEGDVVYADPPYTTVGQGNGFLRYNERLFKWADQVRLARACEDAAQRGAFVVVSGLWQKEILALYKGWWARQASRKSLVSRLPAARRSVSEAVLCSKKPNRAVNGLIKI